jgi:hypothetical protein
MYSLAKKITKQTTSNLLSCLLVSSLIFLAACEGDKSFPLPDPIKDTDPPRMAASLPNEATASNFEIDYPVEILFSERMNLESLTTEGGIKLFSGVKEQISGEVGVVQEDLRPREFTLEFSEEPVIAQDLVTGKDIQIPATKVLLRAATGRFALNNSYTVSIESPARDLIEDDTSTAEDERNFIEGNPLIDFITQTGAWKTITAVPNTLIELAQDDTETALSVSKNQFTPKVIAGKNGDTFLLWKQEGASQGVNQLWISRYLVNNKLWALPDMEKQVCPEAADAQCANAVRVDNIDDSGVIDFSAAVNASGQIAVVWSQAVQAGGLISIHANLFDGTKWLGVTEISATGLGNQSGDADSPQVVIDNVGNVVSIWREQGAQSTRIKTNLFQVASGEMEEGRWTEAPAFIDRSDSTLSISPSLAMNEAGRAVAVWSQMLDNRLRIFSNRLRIGENSVWQTPVLIDELNPGVVDAGIGDSTEPKVAVDKNGDAMAVWLKYDGQRNNVWSNRFTGNWRQYATSLEGDRRGDASYPMIDISNNNKALATWVQAVGSNGSQELKARFFEATTGWQAESTITSEAQIHNPIARFDMEGNAQLIWQNGITNGKLSVAYYSKISRNWGASKELSAESTANNVSLAPLFEDGRFLTVWEKIEGITTRLVFNIFSD